MKKVAVTGGSGRIGQLVIKQKGKTTIRMRTYI
jgi:hypothetical protein